MRMAEVDTPVELLEKNDCAQRLERFYLRVLMMTVEIVEGVTAEYMPERRAAVVSRKVCNSSWALEVAVCYKNLAHALGFAEAPVWLEAAPYCCCYCLVVAGGGVAVDAVVDFADAVVDFADAVAAGVDVAAVPEIAAVGVVAAEARDWAATVVDRQTWNSRKTAS